MKAKSIFDLSGKVIIVTGAGRGIGRATALALAAQGAHVVATDLDVAAAQETVRLAQEVGARCTALHHDVSVEQEWRRTIDALSSDFGRLDALVNNAGIMITKPFLETSVEDLEKLLRINTVGVFFGSQAAAPLMIETATQHGAKPSIVNLSSLYGQIAGPAHVAYSASKGAVRAMSKGIAVELAKYGIRVNTVHPGPVNTELLAGAVASLAAHGKLAAGEKGMASVARGHPMGRTAEPADIAGVIAFLCSDAASFMTGAELTVDGGYALL